MVAVTSITYGPEDFVFPGDMGTVLGPHRSKRGGITVAWDRFADDGDQNEFTAFFDEIRHENKAVSIWGKASICGLWSSDDGHVWICPHEKNADFCVFEEAPFGGMCLSGTLRSVEKG